MMKNLWTVPKKSDSQDFPHVDKIHCGTLFFLPLYRNRIFAYWIRYAWRNIFSSLQDLGTEPNLDALWSWLFELATNSDPTNWQSIVDEKKKNK